MKIEVSNDQINWTTAAENTDGSVYAWKNVSVAAVGKYIRITSMCDDLAINEFALKKTDGTGFATLTAVSGNAWQLTDEQNTVPLYPSYMYDAMLVFIQHNLKTDSFKKLLPPLLFSGIFMGLGIASKWTVAYGAVGLAVLFFGKLIVSYREEKGHAAVQKALLNKSIKLCLWCCLLFIAIPFGIYFTAFLPLTTLPHNRYDVFGRFIAYQTHMYNYHSTLQATHPFESPWYQWPFDIRNVWYYGNYSADSEGHIRTISVLGNPLFFWACVPATVYAFVRAVKRHSRTALICVIGFLSAYLPWVLVPRCTFIYHYFTAVPFILIAFLIAYQCLEETASLRRVIFTKGAVTLTVGRILLLACVLVHILMFIAFYPVLTGTLTTQNYANALEWLPSWFFI